MQAQEVSFNSPTATLFYFSFVRKNVFYSRSIQYAYNFYWTDLYVNIYKGVFRTQSNIYGGAPLRKFQESFTVDVRMVLNTPLVKILQEKRFTECHYLSSMVKVDLNNLDFLKLIKSMLV